eukprot:142466-Alexandrium_andersonii.AAC.1
MSASLVGSEMCIRDSCTSKRPTLHARTSSAPKVFFHASTVGGYGGGGKAPPPVRSLAPEAPIG